ncbi:hypothetical protein GLR48_06350 [Loktanella sp. M215]|nr:hypothetical protein [Loktanella sp. M215]
MGPSQTRFANRVRDFDALSRNCHDDISFSGVEKAVSKDLHDSAMMIGDKDCLERGPWQPGVFALTRLATEAPAKKSISIDAIFVKSRRTAPRLRPKKGGRGRLINRTMRGMNTGLHAVTDARGPPIRFVVTASQVCDITGARDCRPDPRIITISLNPTTCAPFP